MQVHKDILIAKMRPGQCIDLEAHATKGIGAEHAKWSPVATAWYRLLPEVVLKSKVTGDDARYLAELCPGLFRLEEVRLGIIGITAGSAVKQHALSRTWQSNCARR